MRGEKVVPRIPGGDLEGGSENLSSHKFRHVEGSWNERRREGRSQEVRGMGKWRIDGKRILAEEEDAEPQAVG